MKVTDYIFNNIDKTTKYHKEDNFVIEDESVIKLPYPYSAPCIEGVFQGMYYWDTYFTQKCLYHTGRYVQAENNIRNFIFLINKYNKIPNGNWTYFLSRSQPPFFGLMIYDYIINDKCNISKSELFDALEKEYNFWEKCRKTENGLNRYSCDFSDEECSKLISCIDSYIKRTGNVIKKTGQNSRNVQAECESGWDFTSRFSGKCADCNPIDLNCLLYIDECILSLLAKELNIYSKYELYKSNSSKRRELIKQMKKDGIYFDINYKTGKLMSAISCAGFFPYFVGIDNNKEDELKLLNYLERDYGLIACVGGKNKFQWSEPNCWAPLNYIAVSALKETGLESEAKRVAGKYIDTIDKIFKKTNNLWEKYNAETGDIDVINEYKMPAMLGWTAGVYLSLRNIT